MVGCIHVRHASQRAAVNTHTSEQCCFKFSWNIKKLLSAPWLLILLILSLIVRLIIITGLNMQRVVKPFHVLSRWEWFFNEGRLPGTFLTDVFTDLTSNLQEGGILNLISSVSSLPGFPFLYGLTFPSYWSSTMQKRKRNIGSQLHRHRNPIARINVGNFACLLGQFSCFG